MAISITRVEHGPADLRAAAAQTRNAGAARRMLALALVLDGRSRTEAAESCGMDRQTLRDWVHRYNQEGIAGLSSRTSPGKPPILTEAQMAELKDLVIRGPDPELHGVVRWRCVDLCAEVARRFNVTIHETTMGRWLKRLHLTRLQPRPTHPKKNVEDGAAFKKTSPAC